MTRPGRHSSIPGPLSYGYIKREIPQKVRTLYSRVTKLVSAVLNGKICDDTVDCLIYPSAAGKAMVALSAVPDIKIHGLMLAKISGIIVRGDAPNRIEYTEPTMIASPSGVRIDQAIPSLDLRYFI